MDYVFLCGQDTAKIGKRGLLVRQQTHNADSKLDFHSITNLVAESCVLSEKTAILYLILSLAKSNLFSNYLGALQSVIRNNAVKDLQLFSEMVESLLPNGQKKLLIRAYCSAPIIVRKQPATLNFVIIGRKSRSAKLVVDGTASYSTNAHTPVFIRSSGVSTIFKVLPR